MKVYVDELPESCATCPCSEFNFDYGYGCNILDVAIKDAGLKNDNCPLQSLTNYTKQVRKEVCEEISWKLNRRLNGVVNGKYSDEFFNGYSYCSSDIENILDQIQGVEDGKINNEK